MITLKRLKKIEETLALEDLEMSTEELLELTKLARLGLWAENHGIPTARFYSTYSPRFHPEGYFEIHIAPGEGGENRFGHFAKSALKTLPKEEKSNG